MSSESNDFDEEFGGHSYEYNIRDCIIFLIEGNEGMIENGYFVQCLETYKNLLRQKCASNKKDKMGLIVFGTEESNTTVENVMILQQYDNVTLDYLKAIKDMISKSTKLCKPASSNYSLFDALTFAFQISDAPKKSINTRNIIILCTNTENPYSNDPNGRRRLENVVHTFKNNNTQLRVIGFPDSWQDLVFYKDLQIISGTFSMDDYRRTCLNDFEDHILNYSRSVCTLPWKISTNIIVEVSIQNLSSVSTLPSKVHLTKDNNEILEKRDILTIDNGENGQSQSQNSSDPTESTPSIVNDSNIFYSKKFCDRDIPFTPDEYKKLKNLGLEPGINIIAFKPIRCDPLYHVSSPYFVTYTSNCTQECKEFFATLISQCTAKNVMPICKIATKSSVFICNLIPSESDGGFYMYKIPFVGTVRDLDSDLERCVYNSEKKLPINETGTQIFKKLMNLGKFQFNPKLFKNPKLDKFIAQLEALALDEEAPSFQDTTLPKHMDSESSAMRKAVMALLKLKDVESIKRDIEQKNKRARIDIRAAAESGKLQSLTVPDLRGFLSSVNRSAVGNKSVLISRIKEYFDLS